MSEDEDREYPRHPLVGVGAIVIRGKEVLLVRRGKEPSKGLWSIPGGLVEIGETVRDAVKREVLEETGIDVEPRDLFEVVDAIHRDEEGRCRFHYVIVDYMSEYRRGEPVAGGDVSEARWVAAGETGRLEMTAGARIVVEKAFRGKSR